MKKLNRRSFLKKLGVGLTISVCPIPLQSVIKQEVLENKYGVTPTEPLTAEKYLGAYERAIRELTKEAIEVWAKRVEELLENEVA